MLKLFRSSPGFRLWRAQVREEDATEVLKGAHAHLCRAVELIGYDIDRSSDATPSIVIDCDLLRSRLLAALEAVDAYDDARTKAVSAARRTMIMLRRAGPGALPVEGQQP